VVNSTWTLTGCTPPYHLLTLLTIFWTCAALIVIAQVMILRSTRRAFRGTDVKGGRAAPAIDADAATPRAQSATLEWFFAIGPAVGIMFLLFFTWRAATRAPVMEVRFEGTTVSALDAAGSAAPRP
jgi:heme/copper-type cytochrome/quinol oxidase subunit 2